MRFSSPIKRTGLFIMFVMLFFIYGSNHAKDRSNDKHYTKAGFFDVHYCQWSDRPEFLLVLFSTELFAHVKKIEVFFPDGGALGSMDLRRYKVLKRKGKPDKKVFMMDVPTSARTKTGWYSATIVMRNGETFRAEDYLYVIGMDLARNVHPPDQAQGVRVPKRLSWDPVPGATHYRIYLKDLWDDGKLIFSSPLLTEPKVDLPAGLIKTNGWYEWSVHARDVNEHVLLGDFNHGSNLVGLQFTTGD